MSVVGTDPQTIYAIECRHCWKWHQVAGGKTVELFPERYDIERTNDIFPDWVLTDSKTGEVVCYAHSNSAIIQEKMEREESTRMTVAQIVEGES